MNLTNIQRGAGAGIAGGVVFGMMMGMMGMLPTIAGMAGLSGAGAGFAIHLLISALIGGTFGALAGPTRRAIGATIALGGLYGMAWWVLGPLTLMPLFMGMGLGVNWNVTAAGSMLPSLMGHVIFGVILGAVYSKLQSTRRAHGSVAHAA